MIIEFAICWLPQKIHLLGLHKKSLRPSRDPFGMNIATCIWGGRGNNTVHVLKGFENNKFNNLWTNSDRHRLPQWNKQPSNYMWNKQTHRITKTGTPEYPNKQKTYKNHHARTNPNHVHPPNVIRKQAKTKTHAGFSKFPNHCNKKTTTRKPR